MIGLFVWLRDFEGWSYKFRVLLSGWVSEWVSEYDVVGTSTRVSKSESKCAQKERNVTTTKLQQAFMGHSFIFGILLDALLPYGNQEQQSRSSGKVTPTDTSANLHKPHNLFEMGIEGTFTRAVRCGNRWSTLLCCGCCDGLTDFCLLKKKFSNGQRYKIKIILAY